MHNLHAPPYTQRRLCNAQWPLAAQPARRPLADSAVARSCLVEHTQADNCAVCVLTQTHPTRAHKGTHQVDCCRHHGGPVLWRDLSHQTKVQQGELAGIGALRHLYRPQHTRYTVTCQRPDGFVPLSAHTNTHKLPPSESLRTQEAAGRHSCGIWCAKRGE